MGNCNSLNIELILEKQIFMARLNFCMNCSKKLKGRIDKKFCNDFCKNTFNNNAKAPVNNLMRNINNALARNRKILENCFSDNKSEITLSKEILFQLGYNFNYYTGTLLTENNHVYYYCYNLGFREGPQGEIYLSKMLFTNFDSDINLKPTG